MSDFGVLVFSIVLTQAKRPTLLSRAWARPPDTLDSAFSISRPGPYATISICTFSLPRSACTLRALLSARRHFAGSLSLTWMTSLYFSAFWAWTGKARASSINAISAFIFSFQFVDIPRPARLEQAGERAVGEN